MIKVLIAIVRNLYKNNAPIEQYYLEIGTYLLRKGTGYQVGDSINLPITKHGKVTTRKVWISNLFFDFAKNKVTHQFTTKNPLTNENKG